MLDFGGNEKPRGPMVSAQARHLAGLLKAWNAAGPSFKVAAIDAQYLDPAIEDKLYRKQVAPADVLEFDVELIGESIEAWRSLVAQTRTVRKPRWGYGFLAFAWHERVAKRDAAIMKQDKINADKNQVARRLHQPKSIPDRVTEMHRAWRKLSLADRRAIIQAGEVGEKAAMMQWWKNNESGC